LQNGLLPSKKILLAGLKGEGLDDLRGKYEFLRFLSDDMVYLLSMP
jgi:hypothetical protein